MEGGGDDPVRGGVTVGAEEDEQQREDRTKVETGAPSLCTNPFDESAGKPSGTVGSPNPDPTAGVALKVATTVIHPMCLGESSLMLPIHLQMTPPSPLGAQPYFLSGPGPVSLPLVLDQQVLQHLNSSVISPGAGCPPVPLQNPLLCPNPLNFGISAPVDPKTAGPTPDANLLSLLQNPAFTSILQDLFPPQAGSPHFPPPYSPSLAPLVPPATLLVPYPVIIPLPVPLPVPLPLPIPVPLSDAPGAAPKHLCTVNRSTQTSSEDHTPAFLSQSAPTTTHEEGQVLDLSVRPCPIQPKQEEPPPPQQESVLDLSSPSSRRKCSQVVQDVRGAGPSLTVDSKLLGSLASLEFSRQHKWVVDTGAGASGSLGQDGSLGGAGKIVSASQKAKVIVSVKDAIPAILCGKIKGLSGVSTKNFSIKRDGSQGAALQQLYGMPAGAHRELQDPGNPHKKGPKSRAIKLKKVSSQEIHFLPIKKQRLAALLPRK